MSSPDVDPRQGEAAIMAQQLSKEQLDWVKQIYATDLKPLSDRQQALAEENARIGMDIARENQAWSQQDRQFLMDNYRPVEAQLAQRVAGMNTEDYAARKAQDAEAGVEDSFAAAQQQAQRNLARQGIAVGSAQKAAAELNGAVNKAGMVAQARTTARNLADDLTFQRQASVAQVGRGLNPNTSASTALAGGSSAISGTGQALAGAQGAAGTVQQGYSTAINGNLGAANQFGQINQANAQASAGWSSALGSIAGAAIIKSDENAKENIKEVDGESARKGLRKAEPKAWRYKLGEGPEGEHVGAMAQDLNKALGPSVSDGKQVNGISMIGTLHAATVAVDKRVDKLTKKIDALASSVRQSIPVAA
jgi:hypothetical protein